MHTLYVFHEIVTVIDGDTREPVQSNRTLYTVRPVGTVMPGWCPIHDDATWQACWDWHAQYIRGHDQLPQAVSIDEVNDDDDITIDEQAQRFAELLGVKP